MICHWLEIHVYGKCPGLGLTFHVVMFYIKSEFIVLRLDGLFSKNTKSTVCFSLDNHKLKSLSKQLCCVVIELRVSKPLNASCVLLTQQTFGEIFLYYRTTHVVITGSDFYVAHGKNADGESVPTRERQADLQYLSFACQWCAFFSTQTSRYRFYTSVSYSVIISDFFLFVVCLPDIFTFLTPQQILYLPQVIFNYSVHLFI